MDAMDLLTTILTGLMLFIPAMIPNSAAAVFGGGTKMDFGRSWRGKRIFGDGKSWRGFFLGAFSGVAIGLMIVGISYIWNGFPSYGEFPSCVPIIVCLSFGAVIGDLAGAFTKRRLGIERGQKAPILDQYDFVAGALLLTALFHSDWVYSTYIEGWNIVALIFILAFMFGIHRAANIVGYRMGFKKEPW